jgi:RHS repeat-associated protein
VHDYDYDQLGRLLHDRVTLPSGSAVDAAVLRLSRDYNVQGLLNSITSYNNATVGSGTIVNQVQKLYDGIGNLTEDRQSADGAVVSGCPEAHYEYSASTNLLTRLLSLKVEVGGVLQHEFDYRYDATEADDMLGRVSSIAIAGEDGDKVAYTYMGEARVVEVGYPQPQITLSYIKGSTDPVGDAGDPYTGYDRFGRTVDMPWRNNVGTVLDRFQYGYDAAGNRLWKKNLAATSGGQDEFYGYDRLYQVTASARGNLNLNRTAIGAVPAQAEAFGYDSTGNWETYQQQSNGTTVLDQSRVHNLDNQMVQIDGNASGISYDLAGNATLLPPQEGGDWDASYQLIWDAWNRLLVVKSADGSTTIASYSYDGLSRRLLTTIGDLTRQYLYNNEWKPLLEWDPASAPELTRKRYLWGAMHRDELVLRDRILEDTDERLYMLHDYFSPTALANVGGDVLERYGYSAFGIRRIMAGDFSDRSSSSYDWTCGFQGQFIDTESGFYNYGYRYYSPDLGRWINRDPIAEQGGDNLYAYAENDAVNQLDHLGLSLTADPKYKGWSVGAMESQTELALTTANFTAYAIQTDKCIVTSGQLSISITSVAGQTADSPVKYAVSKTLGQHEFGHRDRYSNAWTELVNDTLNIEGCYCNAQCAQIALNGFVANREYFVGRIDKDGADWDLSEYGSLVSASDRAALQAKRDAGQAKMNVALQTLDDLATQWFAAHCTYPRRS